MSTIRAIRKMEREVLRRKYGNKSLSKEYHKRKMCNRKVPVVTRKGKRIIQALGLFMVLVLIKLIF